MPGNFRDHLIAASLKQKSFCRQSVYSPSTGYFRDHLIAASLKRRRLMQHRSLEGACSDFRDHLIAASLKHVEPGTTEEHTISAII